MSDRIICPECEGRCGQRLGRLFLACRFCGGLGWVGDTNEPGERDGQPPPSPPAAWEHRVWQDFWVSSQVTCRYCLDAKVVSMIDDEARTLVTAPCPACAPGPSSHGR